MGRVLFSFLPIVCVMDAPGAKSGRSVRRMIAGFNTPSGRSSTRSSAAVARAHTSYGELP